MPKVVVELPLTLEFHRARICAQPGAAGGWDATTEVDGQSIGTRYCGDWHRVERYRARMQHWLETMERGDVVAPDAWWRSWWVPSRDNVGVERRQRLMPEHDR